MDVGSLKVVALMIGLGVERTKQAARCLKTASLTKQRLLFSQLGPIPFLIKSAIRQSTTSHSRLRPTLFTENGSKRRRLRPLRALVVLWWAECWVDRLAR